MKKSSRHFWIWAAIQIIALAAIFGGWFVFVTLRYLAHPTDGDLYAHSWSFQAIAFCFYGLPLFIVVSFILIAIERAIFHFIQRRQSDDTPSA
jgi:hypothetical protein